MSQFFDEFEAAIDEPVPRSMPAPVESTPRAQRTPIAEAEVVDDDESAVAASDVGSVSTQGSSSTPNSKKKGPPSGPCLGCGRGRSAPCFYRLGCEVQWALKLGRGAWCLDCHSFPPYCLHFQTKEAVGDGVVCGK